MMLNCFVFITIKKQSNIFKYPYFLIRFFTVKTCFKSINSVVLQFMKIIFISGKRKKKDKLSFNINIISLIRFLIIVTLKHIYNDNYVLGTKLNICEQAFVIII